MNITLYKNSAENNKLDKTAQLTTITNYTGCVARGRISMMSPVVVIEDSADIIKQGNYLYIADYGRYYFIEDITADANGLWTITCRCDVLMSFKHYIRDLSGIVNRQENIYDMYIPSGDIPTDVRPLITTKKFEVAPLSNAFSTQTTTYILLALGGR